MELILKETIDTLGEEGDVVKVKNGYGRNFLIPRRLAVLANKSNLTVLEKEKAAIVARKQNQREEAEALAKKVAGATVVITHRSGEDNKLFGSVTAADIAEKLATLGIELDKKKIVLAEPIKTLGVTMVPVKIGYQISAEITVEIVPLAAE
ncbi:MAG: 50S ribosomal protein L9 [Desulfurivibrio sp.]|nr:50S ribosomal protein L9 [Desulfurivibrio sp.]MBU3936570.1 50S ribosomal protein L9 [Pseudomonadota bacterium]MBU4033439.1 50S ribosomal protein L9 [Pseudomonadota bacterium]MBU4119702.1 50S ribosomal protein L9 [Pseudomonadota bacterium]